MNAIIKALVIFWLASPILFGGACLLAAVNAPQVPVAVESHCELPDSDDIDVLLAARADC